MRIRILRDLTIQGGETLKAGEIVEAPSEELKELTTLKPPWVEYVDYAGNPAQPSKPIFIPTIFPARGTKPEDEEAEDGGEE